MFTKADPSEPDGLVIHEGFAERTRVERDTDADGRDFVTIDFRTCHNSFCIMAMYTPFAARELARRLLNAADATTAPGETVEA